ncbi:polyphosphate kinase 2 [Chitinibacter bivalviorum]|uniref:ADP/GDP-polyphosphate phosphotransferase n=1 Tax=Chitinibacter bivalviorum TaxID=2739434 RepID=A0A7H9BLC6_9NEIS|nr:polyphosphate kinase 2 [Chitinibacter bivalviorum]QLG89383.1 polyphosphate kinase 2 [Chitinibacter bivalviorum]
MSKKKSQHAETTVHAQSEMGNKEYAKALKKLQIELVKLQLWVKQTGQKIIIVFEGRDGAGKGGTIKALTERVSPRVFRVVALPAPTDKEKTQLYMQRYFAQFPSAGEIVIFDRSWYNRAGVERVMGFCTEEQSDRFLEITPLMEKYITQSGVTILKYWLDVDMAEQTRRLQDRIEDGRKLWKLTEMDLKSFTKWDEYTKARDRMMEYTDTVWCPWHVAISNDKKRTRLNIISHILKQIPYEALPHAKIKLPKRKPEAKTDKEPHPFRYIPMPF